MNPQYEILAKCLLPAHMLEWFELTNVEVRPKEKKANQDQQSEEYSPNVIHLYLDENELTPDLIFADPPYDCQHYNELVRLIFDNELLNDDGLFVLEHDKYVHFDEHPHFMEQRHYGKVNFSFFAQTFSEENND